VPEAGAEPVLRIGRGDDFGAHALISGKPALLSARALTSGAVLELKKVDLSALIEARPELKAEFERILAARAVLGKAGSEAESAVPEPANMMSKFFHRIGAILPSRDLG
jgi:CRP-like cAMP-binding protein